jgi:hypothetical protein
MHTANGPGICCTIVDFNVNLDVRTKCTNYKEKIIY